MHGFNELQADDPMRVVILTRDRDQDMYAMQYSHIHERIQATHTYIYTHTQ